MLLPSYWSEQVSRLQRGELTALLRMLWAQTHIRWLVAILLVALALRLIWVVAVQPDPRAGRFDDTIWYNATARAMADGGGYNNPFFDTPTARWPVGYPILLSLVYRLPGDDVAAARGLNVAASLIAVVAVYYLGQRLWDRRVGLLAAAVLALFPGYLFFSTLVMTEIVFTALAVSVLALALAWTMSGPAPPRLLVLLGVTLGVTTLVRPEGMILAGVLTLTWFAVSRSWRRTAVHLALLLVGVAIVLGPWTARNIIQLRAPVVATTGLGGTLIQGHHADADGRPSLPIQTELEAKFADVEFPEQEVRINNAGIRESISFAVRNPQRELSLIPKRFAYFIRGDRGAIDWVQHPDGAILDQQSAGVATRTLSSTTAERLGMLADVYYYVAIGVALAGLPFILLRRRPEQLLLLLPVLAYVSIWSVLFVGESRYHIPLLPMLSLAAAVGVVSAIGWFQQQRE